MKISLAAMASVAQRSENFMIDVFLEFLECAIHQIVYHRHVYPKESFEITQLYSIRVYRSRHPDVCSYISCRLEELKVWSFFLDCHGIFWPGEATGILMCPRLNNSTHVALFDVSRKHL